MNTEQLIAECREGKAAAQRELYTRYANRMMRVIYRYVRSQMDAEDVLISGFLKVYQNVHKMEYRGERSLDGWIKRIMVNEALMFLRKTNVFTLRSDSEVPDQDAGDYADNDLRAEDIYKLIRELPDGYRTVFNLYAIEGYTHQEIADQLGINVNTSKSQLSKARAALQRKIKAQETND